MKNRQLARCLVYPALLLALASGCQAFHSYRPVTIQARDIETKKPIPGAEVRLTYPLASSSTAPWEAVGTTSSDGVVRLRAAPYGEAGILLDVTRPGFMTEQKSFPIDMVEAVKPAGFFETIEKRPADLVVELYSEPFPGVELVFPNGFRGTAKVAVTIRDDVPHSPGQRQFSYEVPASGVLHITGPVLLRHVFGSNFTARYADGSLLKRQPKDDEVGFWNLKTEEGYDYFVVGTRAEFEELRRNEQKDAAPEKPSSGGKGGGRGKRSRGGSQSTSDSGDSSSNQW